MNISEALDGMRHGNKLARDAWPAGCYVEFVSKDHPTESGNRDYLRVFNPEGLIDYDIGILQAVWQPLDIDLLADDWCLFVEAAAPDWKSMYLELRDQFESMDAGLKIEIHRGEVKDRRIRELEKARIEQAMTIANFQAISCADRMLMVVPEGEYQRDMGG